MSPAGAGRRDGKFDFNETRITALAACGLPGFLYAWYRPDGRRTLTPWQANSPSWRGGLLADR
jgi:hypothetical protein